MFGDPCPRKTGLDLEWPRVLDALADRCAGVPGQKLARALPFQSSHDDLLRALGEVKEACALDATAEPLPLAGLTDLGPAVERARIGAALSSEELRAVRDGLIAARRLRRFLHSRKERAPLLFEACATDPTLDRLEDVLSAAFDPDGTIADRASPRLGALRAERKATRERLVRRLEELARKHEGILQDAFWTERDGRYVLPVRADTHERFPGIVHATSASGATIFIEPRTVVPMGNRQKMLDADVAREEEAVLAALSSSVAEVVEEVAAAAGALTHADVRAASAKLAKDLALSFPIILDREGDVATIELKAARHPLLALDGVRVVPSDLAVSGGRAMVVSGPNAGGKTVALKTLGLAALMVRAGLPIAAAEGSRVTPFDLVLTDVGDDQSITKNLSTFSAHVKNLAEILDETAPGVLVLLDELAGGTDPREGEALAAGVLDSLCARGGAVACTTHYEGLKALALGDRRFENASVGFDLATMSPTFRLAVGVPGASSALAVARRFGIPSTVLERAQRFLSSESISFEKMVERLEQERRALDLARLDAEREAEALRARRADLDRELERLATKERTTVTKEGEALLQSLKRAREDLRAAQARLRTGKPDEADVRAAAKLIDQVAAKVAIGGELEPNGATTSERDRVDPSSVRVGLRVYVPRLRAEAAIVEVLAAGQLRVALGSLKLVTHVDEIRASSSVATQSRSQAPRRGPDRRASIDDVASADVDAPIQTSDNSVDLRGLRAHEAVAMAEQFLDRSLGAGRRVAFLIHGHGTGALREAVREALGSSSYVARMSPGGPREGGDGVTVVYLR